MPLVKRRIVAETRGLIIPADDHALTRHLRRRAAEHTKLNLNVLGEAILSDAEAEQRIQRVIGTLQRPDVDYISVKISAVCALLDVYAFEHSVQRICQALRRIYDAAIAADPPTFVNLDMEEYADLELTVESFLKVLDEPPYFTMPAGIVLQAYVPDSHVAMERIGEWAAARVAKGGAPIKVRIVKGANLAMEQVDAEQHGWVHAPYATKADTDASYKRLLDSCLRPEWAGAVRVGVASHNLFEVAWALTLRDELPESRRSDMEIEMLEGMVPAQTRAVQAAAGGMLLYCPIVREDEFDASLAYLSRRFDENTAPENFLRAMFTMTPGSAEFADQAERFRQSVAERSTVTATRRREPVALPTDGSFENHPDTDFTDAAARDAVQAAVNRVMGGDLPDGPYPMTEDVAGDRRGGGDGGVSRGSVGRDATGRAGRVAQRRSADVMDAERGDHARADGGRGGEDGARGRPRGLRGDRLRTVLRDRRDPVGPRVTGSAVRRGRRGVAMELPVRDPRRRRARGADGGQHGHPQAAARDAPDGVAARQPVLARRRARVTCCSSWRAPTTRSARG